MDNVPEELDVAIERRLNVESGQAGALYEGKHKQTDRNVVVKEQPSTVGEWEAQVLQYLNASGPHPNIIEMLRFDGTVAVIDLGLAHCGPVPPAPWLHKGIQGSRSYLAPEVHAPPADGYDPRAADAWSLGSEDQANRL